MNKKTVKIALLVALAVVLAIFPAFENCFSDFEYYGENFSFLTWNTQLMVEHGELYGFEGSPFLNSIIMFALIVILMAVNISMSIMEDRSIENRTTFGWISVAASVLSVIILIIDIKKIADIFLPSMEEMMFGVYIAVILSVAITVVSFINASSNKSFKAENNTAVNTSENIEKLSSLKELLDSGVITQEEFDEKKKNLLK